MNKLDNVVIEVLDIEHGQKVKQLFERNGEKLTSWKFNSTKKSNDPYRFYGYRYGIFEGRIKEWVETHNLKVLTLEEATKLLDSESEFIFNI